MFLLGRVAPRNPKRFSNEVAGADTLWASEVQKTSWSATKKR